MTLSPFSVLLAVVRKVTPEEAQYLSLALLQLSYLLGVFSPDFAHLGIDGFLNGFPIKDYLARVCR